MFGRMSSAQIVLAEKQSYLARNFVLVIPLNQGPASDYSGCFLSEVTSVPCAVYQTGLVDF